MTKTKLQQAIDKAKKKPVKPGEIVVTQKNINKVIKETKKALKGHKKSKPTKQVKAGRGKDGKFKPGYSGNPKGREKGLSITEMVRQELLKDRKTKGKTKKQEYAKMLVARILKKAIQEGDRPMIDKIWAYMDGTPTQMVDAKITGDISLRELCKKAKDED